MTSGLSDLQIVIAVVCSITGLALLAILIRWLVPRCRKKKHKLKPDDRSLVKSSKSPEHGENQFIYSGPLILPMDTKSGPGQTSLPVPHSPQKNRDYVNAATEEYRQSSAWVSGSVISRQTSQEERTTEDINPSPAPHVVDGEIRNEMKASYQKNSSDVHNYAKRGQQIMSRETMHDTRQETVSEETSRDLDALQDKGRTIRLNQQTSREPSQKKDHMPPRIPQQIETSETKIVSRQPLLKSPKRAKPPKHHVRSAETESAGWKPRAVQRQALKPSWINTALDMSNPGLPRSSSTPSSHVLHTNSQTSKYTWAEPEQLSATDVLRSRQYIEGAPFEPHPQDNLEWKAMKEYGHFKERRGYGYMYQPGHSWGFVPIDSDWMPTDLQRKSERQAQTASVDTNNSSNMRLSPYFNNGALKPLDMSSRYRENWDNQFDPYGLGQQNMALNHYAHPSENTALGPDVPTWYEAQHNRQYRDGVTTTTPRK